MTDPTDMAYQPPLDGADDSGPQVSSSDALAEPNTDAAPEAGANRVGDVAEVEGEPDGPGEPEDFADHSPEQIDRDLGALKRLDDSLGRQAWIYRMQTFPRVRALKDKVGGTKFEAICKRALKLNKTYAYQIVSRLYREDGIVQEIWDKVIADAHAASIRGDDFQYPATKTMLNWYKPDDEDETADTDAPADDNTGDNDPRTKGQIIKAEIMLKGELETVMRDLVREKTARTELTRDYDIVSKQATERKNDLDLLREMASKERQDAKAEIAARDRMLAEQNQAAAAALAEITRLKALVPPNDNVDTSEPDPDPDPPSSNNMPEPNQTEHEPPLERGAVSGFGGGVDENGIEIPFVPTQPVPNSEKQAKPTLGDISATIIDSVWNAPKGLRGGAKPADRTKCETNRPKAYALLHLETDVAVRLRAKEKFNTMSRILWWASLTDDMDVPAMLQHNLEK